LLLLLLLLLPLASLSLSLVSLELLSSGSDLNWGAGTTGSLIARQAGVALIGWESWSQGSSVMLIDFDANLDRGGCDWFARPRPSSAATAHAFSMLGSEIGNDTESCDPITQFYSCWLVCALEAAGREAAQPRRSQAVRQSTTVQRGSEAVK
jgi:hypothetical protein